MVGYGSSKKNLISVFPRFQSSFSVAEAESSEEGENNLCDRTVYCTDTNADHASKEAHASIENHAQHMGIHTLKSLYRDILIAILSKHHLKHQCIRPCLSRCGL